ncbi:putative reverse transcriptase domain-containing protein [Tanacetum coccineum]
MVTVGKALTWWNSQIHTQGREAVMGSMSWLDEAIRNGSLKKNTEKRGNGGEPSRDRNVKDDNKMTRTGNAFATTANPVRREYTETAPKCTNYNLHHTPKSPRQACFNCNRLGHLPKECRVVPRMVNPVNARNLLCTRELELEKKGLQLTIDLIRIKAGVLRSHQRNGETLRVAGEKPKEKVRHLRSAKTKEPKKEDIVVVRNFLKVFPDDLSGLPPNLEIEFRINLIPGAIPIVKSPYRLSPFEMEELSGQLKEHQDKGFIQLSSLP